MIDKIKVLWLNEVEQILLEDNGWKLIFMSDHFNNHFWYEIQNPEGHYLDFITEDIYEAIDKINQEQKIKN